MQPLHGARDAANVLGVGPQGFGFLRAAPAVGAGLMAVVLAFRPITRRAGPRMLLCVGLFGLAAVVFGLSRSFPLSLVALTVMGAADMVSVVVRMTLEQLAVVLLWAWLFPELRAVDRLEDTRATSEEDAAEKA